jgi:hypothetical protein
MNASPQLLQAIRESLAPLIERLEREGFETEELLLRVVLKDGELHVHQAEFTRAMAPADSGSTIVR